MIYLPSLTLPCGIKPMTLLRSSSQDAADGVCVAELPPWGLPPHMSNDCSTPPTSSCSPVRALLRPFPRAVLVQRLCDPRRSCTNAGQTVLCGARSSCCHLPQQLVTLMPASLGSNCRTLLRTVAKSRVIRALFIYDARHKQTFVVRHRA